MPTGYTADVQSGKVTDFPEFAMQCARAFGALIMMRDDPRNAQIPEQFKPQTSYYDEQITAAKATLADIGALSEADCQRRAQAEHADALKHWRTRHREKTEQKTRYEAMIAKTEAWIPPTPDHTELRTFMVKQLRESIDFDCSSSYDNEPVAQDAEAWRAATIAKAERDLEYGLKHRQEEIERTDGCNKWVADLRASL